MDSTRRVSAGQRLEGVDVLRGLAILLVLLNHVNMRLRLARVPYTEGLPGQLVTSLVWNGQRAVQIFFAVSGFLITATSLRRWGGLAQVSLRGFYGMRIARIAPLLLMILGVLSGLHLAQVEHYVVGEKAGGLGRALLAALTFHVNVLEARRGYLPGSWDILWSLSVEEMFYLFFPVAALLFGRGKLFVGVLLGFVALGPLSRTVFTHGNEIWKEYSYLGGMDAISLGCLTALVVSQIQFSRNILRAAGTIGVALLVFSLCFSLQGEAWGLERTGLDMTVVAVGACLVIAAAAQSNWKGPRIISPLLRIGERSYEVYLTHMFVVFGAFGFFVRAGKPMWGVPALFTGVIAAAGLLGEVVARIYSEPLNRWIRDRWKSGKVVESPAGETVSERVEL
ncbi:MAG TPA: acyltransferase [Candidatus Acidoferrum sp.]|nr:acyltransferase [Candidatus Acidoferrum sp.]